MLVVLVQILHKLNVSVTLKHCYNMNGMKKMHFLKLEMTTENQPSFKLIRWQSSEWRKTDPRLMLMGKQCFPTLHVCVSLISYTHTHKVKNTNYHGNTHIHTGFSFQSLQPTHLSYKYLSIFPICDVFPSREIPQTQGATIMVLSHTDTQ